VHVEALDPLGFFDELHGRRTELEALVQRNGDQETDHRPEQGQPAHGGGMLIAADREQQRAEGNRHPDCKTQQTHFVLFLIS